MVCTLNSLIISLHNTPVWEVAYVFECEYESVDERLLLLRFLFIHSFIVTKRQYLDENWKDMGGAVELS